MLDRMSETALSRLIAAACEPPLDPRTVTKYMRDKAVSQLSAVTIARAFKKVRITDPRAKGGGQ